MTGWILLEVLDNPGGYCQSALATQTDDRDSGTAGWSGEGGNRIGEHAYFLGLTFPLGSGFGVCGFRRIRSLASSHCCGILAVF